VGSKGKCIHGESLTTWREFANCLAAATTPSCFENQFVR
jgi:hypothetical protein